MVEEEVELEESGGDDLQDALREDGGDGVGVCVNVGDLEVGDSLFNNQDYVLFSLASGSAAFGNAASPYFGLNASDVLIATAGGLQGLQLPGIQLGLLPTDNLDALDVVPEPSVILLLLIGGAGLFIRKRLLY